MREIFNVKMMKIYSMEINDEIVIKNPIIKT